MLRCQRSREVAGAGARLDLHNHQSNHALGARRGRTISIRLGLILTRKAFGPLPSDEVMIALPGDRRARCSLAGVACRLRRRCSAMATRGDTARPAGGAGRAAGRGWSTVSRTGVTHTPCRLRQWLGLLDALRLRGEGSPELRSGAGLVGRRRPPDPRRERGRRAGQFGCSGVAAVDLSDQHVEAPCVLGNAPSHLVVAAADCRRWRG